MGFLTPTPLQHTHCRFPAQLPQPCQCSRHSFLQFSTCYVVGLRFFSSIQRQHDSMLGVVRNGVRNVKGAAFPQLYAAVTNIKAKTTFLMTTNFRNQALLSSSLNHGLYEEPTSRATTCTSPVPIFTLHNQSRPSDSTREPRAQEEGCEMLAPHPNHQKSLAAVMGILFRDGEQQQLPILMEDLHQMYKGCSEKHSAGRQHLGGKPAASVCPRSYHCNTFQIPTLFQYVG